MADPPISGLNVADRVMELATKFYRKICVTRIELVAGLSRGGSLWPKFGFRPRTVEDWRKCRSVILNNLKQLPTQIREQWEPAIEAITAMPSPRAIWLISEISDILHGPEIPDKLRGVKLGDILLSGTNWPGVLDFRDDHASRILDERLKAIP